MRKARKVFQNINASLLRFCADFRDAMAEEGYIIEVVNLDAFTDEEAWPTGDFIGIAEVTITLTQIPMVECLFAISTRDDFQLYRMATLMGFLSERLLPTSTLTIYDASTGDALGLATLLDGTSIKPPIVTKTQPVRPIIVRMAVDQVSF